jgi:hypothetical protein
LDWKAPQQEEGRTFQVSVPTNEDHFAPVRFESPAQEVRARFAFRRYPWKTGDHAPEHIFEIGYGGTCEVEGIDDRSFRLSPHLFSLNTSLPVPAMLGKKEAIRFWIRWMSKSPLVWNRKQNRLRFEQILDVRPKIYLFNSFFHVPVDLQALPGGLTELRSYHSPPRLFFIWDDLMPEQCLAFNDIFNDENKRIRFSNAFADMRVEGRRLIRIFVLGLLMNLSASILISAIFTTLPSDKFAWVLKPKLCSSTLTALFAICIVHETRGREVRTLPVAITSLLLVFGAIALDLNRAIGYTLLAFAVAASTIALEVYWPWRVLASFGKLMWRPYGRYWRERKFVKGLRRGRKT